MPDGAEETCAVADELYEGCKDGKDAYMQAAALNRCIAEERKAIEQQQAYR